MGRRRGLLWFIVGLIAAVGLAEGSARIGEAAGPPALRWYDASAQLKVEQMDGLDRVDVVFAGTSSVWQGLVPSVFTSDDPEGRTAYNAGLAGGVPVVMEPWLLEVVVPRVDPDLVVWGLTSMDFSTSYGEENLERYRDALDGRTGALATVERATSRFSALVRYRTILRRPSALFGSARDAIEADFEQAATTLGPGGERLDFGIDTSPERARQLEARLLRFRIDPADIDAIDRTVAALRADGTEVVFALMPMPARYTALHPEGEADVARADETVIALGELLGVPVIDLRSGFTDDDFVDFTHLDAGGAEALTRSLADVLDGVEPQQPPPPTTSTTTPIDAASTTSTTVAANTLPTDQLLATAGEAIASVEQVYRQLYGGGSESETEAFWTSSHQLGRYGDLLNGVADGGFDLVFVGSSLAVNGFDPVLAAEETGLRVFNAALPALTPEELNIWLDSVVRLADPDVVVYGTETRDVRILGRDPENCGDGVEDWVLSEEVRAAVFGTVDAYDDLWWENLMFGDPIAFQASERHRSRSDEFGGRVGGPSSTPAEIEKDAQKGAWGGPFPLCAPRIDAVAANVAKLKSRGVTVIVAFMPISDWRADLFEGGREEAAEITALMREAVLAEGADWILDYSALLPKDHFGDISHANATGRRVLTEAFLEDLASLGL